MGPVFVITGTSAWWSGKRIRGGGLVDDWKGKKTRGLGDRGYRRPRVKNRTLERHKGAAPGRKKEKQIPHCARDDKLRIADEWGRRREAPKTEPEALRSWITGGLLLD